jgi:hypothetical protein
VLCLYLIKYQLCWSPFISFLLTFPFILLCKYLSEPFHKNGVYHLLHKWYLENETDGTPRVAAGFCRNIIIHFMKRFSWEDIYGIFLKLLIRWMRKEWQMADHIIHTDVSAPVPCERVSFIQTPKLLPSHKCIWSYYPWDLKI